MTDQPDGTHPLLTLNDLVVLAVIGEEPAHGFALSRLLAPESDLGRILTLRRAQVYRAIDRLAEADLVEPLAVEPGDGGPVRTVLTITPAGRRALADWLDRPVDHVRDLRVEFLIKLRLRERLGRNPTELLAVQRQALGPTLDRLATAGGPGADVVDRWRAANATAAARFLGYELDAEPPLVEPAPGHQ
ncbi:MAG: PadR family transcriptional regulator [Actinomycetota bacterium]